MSSGGLSAGYGIDRVVALPCDPYRLLIFWEVTSEGVGRAKDSLGELAASAELTLRVSDDGGVARDVTVSDWIGQRSVDGLKPGGRYFAAVGWFVADCFAPVTSSVPVALPLLAGA